MYSGINGCVNGPKWKSDRFYFKRGVFQGDPLSPTIFITVFNPLLEYLHSEAKHGYYLNNNSSVISTPFADDFNVITGNSRSHQRILLNVEKYAKTMNLVLEPSKCKSLSICGGSSRVVNFKLSEQIIKSLDESPEKFLGSQITFSGKQSDIYQYISSGIKDALENINNTSIRSEYKLKIYVRYLIPAIRFKLTVHELTATNLTKLDLMCDSYVKRWLSMPPSGTRAVIHSPEALNIKSISHLYKEAHATSHASSRLKADKTVNLALDCKVQRETKWVRKGSVAVYCEEQYQMATDSCSDKSDDNNYADTIKKKVKNNISEEHRNMWYDHVKSLSVQGRFLEILHIENSHITWRSLIFNLPRGILQFAVNASIDTLATNANLKRWGKRRNAKCDMCSQRETLHHVLNNCDCMLERYTWRHNSVLNYIISLVQIESETMYSDLAGMMTGCSTIPTDVVITSQRPDLVIVNRAEKKITLLELSIPFEQNIETTHQYKTDRYSNLIVDIESNGFNVKYYAIEIGSRGYINTSNIQRLKSFIHNHCKDSKLSEARDTISKISLVCSFIIYHSKFDKDWINPAYVRF